MTKKILLLGFLSTSLMYGQETNSSENDMTIGRAIDTIEAADQQFSDNQSAVLESENEAGIESEAPAEVDLPDAPQFEVSDDDIFLELPGADEGSTSVATESDTITIDFPQEDVRNIIRNVADLYELNVVIPDSLTGSVSIKLKDVSWRQVLEVVLEPLNYTYVEDGNIIKIKSLDELAIEPVDTRVFIVNFAKAGEIKSSIEPLIHGETGGRIKVDTRSNALVITERPSQMNSIQEIIETLDRPTEQVMIESKFVEITARDAKDVGIEWSSLAGYNVSAGPFSREFKDVNSRSKDNQSGVTVNQSNTTTNGIPTGSLSSQGIDKQLTSWTPTLTRTDTAVFSADAFSMVISALKAKNDIELISNPTVVTLNNTPANIHIGEEYPVPDFGYNDEQGTFVINGFNYIPIGISLKVHPQINSAGFINLNIEPKIDTRTGEVPFDGVSIPLISTRRTSSTVTIKSGYTLAIGGLIQKNTENRDARVPVLGSIPVVGNLFKSESKAVDQNNLIIFITAKILSASGATYRDVFSQRTLYEMGIKARDLPGYEPPETERSLFDSIQASRDEIERLQTELNLRQQLEILQSATEKEEQKSDGEEKEVRRRYQ